MGFKQGIRIQSSVVRRMEEWAKKAYPHEGCGLLIGRFNGTDKEATDFVSLSNTLLSDRGKSLEQRIKNSGGVITSERAAQGGKTEFLMDPAEFERVSRETEKRGLDVVGIVHTHPDHPPQPSVMDASQPMLAGWSNIIVAVEKGKSVEAKSWFRNDDRSPFEEEPISIV